MSTGVFFFSSRRRHTRFDCDWSSDVCSSDLCVAAKKSAVKRKKTKPTTPRRDALVIVESPTKAKTIGKYLGSGYTVKATVGHVRDLPQRELGVDVDNGFTPKYVTIKEKAKTLAEIKKAAKQSERVLIATDPDREGEAIAWHVAETLGNGTNVRRVLFHEITKDTVRQALANPLEIDQRKVDAQQARRVLDRLVGYKTSPLLWKSIKTGLSAGRVQTVALRLICEREEDIRRFVPQEYWTVEADLEKDGQPFQARLHKLDGHKPEIKDAAAAQAVVADARKLPFRVTTVEKGERRRPPPDRRAGAPRRPERTPRRQAAQAVPADLAGVRGVADDPRRVRDHEGGLRPGPLRVPGHRLARAVRRLPRAVPRGARAGGREDARGSAPDTAAGGGRRGDGAADHADPAFHRAAAALQRSEPRKGAGAPRDRTALHLRDHHLDAEEPLVRDGEGPPLPPHAPGRDRVARHEALLPRRVRGRVHGADGDRAG